MTVTTEIGKPRARKEDARLLTGQTNWTDNIVLPGMLHVCYVRSPMAHARIRSVDVSAARSAPGVIAAFSGADFAAEQGSLPCAWPVTPDIIIPAHPPMATDEVRYVGEIVACVVARDHYTAADALETWKRPWPTVRRRCTRRGTNPSCGPSPRATSRRRSATRRW